MTRRIIIALALALACMEIAAQPIASKYVDELKSLGDHPRIQKAFEHILENDGKTQEDHILLTEIPAPPFGEEKRGIAFAELLRLAGADSVWIDEAGNVLALRKGKHGKRTVVLDGHLDTVFPEGTDVSVVMRGDTMYAPGVGDDTRGLAMVLAVLRAVEETGIGLNDNVLFVGTTGEEGLGDLRGVKHLFREGGPRINSWISIDGGAIGRVTTKGLGSYRYKVTFEGPGGHSWGAFGMVNPHHALGVAIDKFSAQAHAFTSSGPRTSFNVGRIGGGTSVNSIPYASWMEIDMRSVSPERLDSMDVILKRTMRAALEEENERARFPSELTLKMERIGDRPSGELPPSLPLIQRAMAATAFFGKRPSLSRGSTNSNIPIALGIPAVTIGRGGVGANGHSLNEWWLNKEGHKATQLALLLLVSEAGLSD